MQYYIYKFLNLQNEIIYIGRSNDIEKRIDYHFSKHGHLDKEAYSETTHIEFLNVPTKIDMQILELYYINIYKPKYNKKDKQSKMLSLKINCDDDKWIAFPFERKQEKEQEVRLSKDELSEYLDNLIGKRLDKDMQIELIDRINHKVDNKQQRSYSKLNIGLQMLGLPHIIIPKKSNNTRYWIIEKSE